MKTNLVEIYQSLPELDVSNIVDKFNKQNTYFKYYIPSDKATELYTACYNSLKQYFVNSGDVNHLEDAYIYKMMFLFQSDDFDPVATLANFDKFANKYINGFDSLKAFLSDNRFDKYNFIQNLEYTKFDYDIVGMRKALPSIGYALLKNLADLSKIQSCNDGEFPANIQSFKEASLKVKFPKAHKNMKLAELCNMYDGDNTQFSDMINLMERGVLPSINGKLTPKKFDNMPDVTVHYVNPDTGSNYYLVKLPSHDPRAMMLGNATGNCQTLANNGGDADPFIIDGITRANNGFYVIIKQGRKAFNPTYINWGNLEKDGHEIVGQSYAWIGRDGETITWEAPQLIKDRAPNIDVKEILTKFGQAVAEQGFSRVTIGTHRKGFEGAKKYNFDDESTIYTKTQSHNIFNEGFKYIYSIQAQYEVYVSNALQVIREEIGGEYVGSVTSTKQGEVLKEFLMGKTLNPTLKKVIMSCYLTKDWRIETLEMLLPILEERAEFALELMFNYDLLYKYGLTIECALKLPFEVLDLLLDLVSNPAVFDNDKMQSFASLVNSLDELSENITAAGSKLDIKKAAVRLIARNISNDVSNLEYVDSMSEAKVEFITNNNAAVELLYKKHYTVFEIAQMDDSKYSVLAKYTIIIRNVAGYCNRTIKEYIDQFDSELTMKRSLLKDMIAYDLMDYKVTCDQNLDNLSVAKLDLLLISEVMHLPSYEQILQAAMDLSVLDLKKKIFVLWAENNALFENIVEMDITEDILDILLSSEVMSFYAFRFQNCDDGVREYFKRFDNILQLPAKKIELLFSQEAQNMYFSNFLPSDLAVMEVDEIIALFAESMSVSARGDNITDSGVHMSINIPSGVRDQSIIEYFGQDRLDELRGLVLSMELPNDIMKIAGACVPAEDIV